MKNISLIMLSCIVLICHLDGARTRMRNVDKTLDMVRTDQAWGKLNYTTFSHFDVTFDQFDLKRTKTAMINGGLRIPMGVTHVYLNLSGSFDFIEFPETIKYINKDIFKECEVKAILVSPKTINSILKKDYGENEEENIRRYFSLNSNTEIITGKIIGIQDKKDIPQLPSNVVPEKPKNFLDEIHNFDKKKLKHEDEPQTKENQNNNFLDEVHNFNKNQLKHVVEEEKEQKKTVNSFIDEINNFNKDNLKHRDNLNDRPQKQDELNDLLRKAMEKRRKDIAPEESNTDIDDELWDD